MNISNAPRNAWYMAAWGTEVVHQPMARTLVGEPVVLFRDFSGQAVALEDRCCHRGVPLSRGECTESGLQCGYHGLVFGADGRCVLIPGQDHIPPQMRVRSFPVCEQDGILWIWMGDPALARRDDIPCYPFHHAETGWPHRTTMQSIHCNYQLVVDNLLDLTHLAFVHKSTIGGNPQAHTRAEMNVENTARGVKFIRWLLDSVPPPLYQNQVPFVGRVDRWMEFEFIAPGTVLQFTGAIDVGTGAYDKGKRDGGFALRIFHGITPATDGTCFYFWSAAHGHKQDDRNITEALFKGITTAFKEDEVILEAQYARVRELSDRPLYGTRADVARVRADTVLREMTAAEARGG